MYNGPDANPKNLVDDFRDWLASQPDGKGNMGGRVVDGNLWTENGWYQQPPADPDIEPAYRTDRPRDTTDFSLPVENPMKPSARDWGGRPSDTSPRMDLSFRPPQFQEPPPAVEPPPDPAPTLGLRDLEQNPLWNDFTHDNDNPDYIPRGAWQFN